MRQDRVSQRRSSADVLNTAEGLDVTVVGDIRERLDVEQHLTCGRLHAGARSDVPNPFRAVVELHRILSLSGRPLLTVPAAYPYHAVPQDLLGALHVTCCSCRLASYSTRCRSVSWGNRVARGRSLWYWAHDQLPRDALLRRDPDNPVLLSVYARK